MNGIERSRISLATGVTLDVWLGGGNAGGLPLMFLHGFPESAERTWRHQLVCFAGSRPIAAPDQRGFAGSDKPEHVEEYRPSRIVADVMALADHLGWDRFVLIGHDWGGAAGWATALARPERLAGLVIFNAPHPYIFQKTVIEDPAQCAASQYIADFRSPDMEQRIEDMGRDAWLDWLFADQLAAGLLNAADRAAYLREWAHPGAMTAMLNWYRASPAVVPPLGSDLKLDWLAKPFPRIQLPVQVVWGINDRFLLPVQLTGLNEVVANLDVVTLPAGHFSPWEAPTLANAAIKAFLDRI